MKQARIIGIGAATALILAAGGATALAASSGTIPAPGGVIESCYANTGHPAGIHAVTIRNSAVSCPKGTTALNWNQSGTAGPAGLDETVVTANGTGGVATATCPARQPIAISGGGQAFDVNGNVGTPAPMAASMPGAPATSGALPGSWVVIAVYTTAEPGPGGVVSTVNAFAVCTR